MERSFKKEIDSLNRVFEFLEECTGVYEIDAGSSYVINLAVEELFTNMVKYSPESTNDVSVRVSTEGKEVVVTLVDRGVKRFDVTQTKPVDVTKRIEERKPGGLGIHLTKELVDSLRYEYEGGTSRIIFTKKLE